MPMCAIGLPSGPIENGTTYSVRPRMQPSKSPFSVRRISARRDPVVGRARVVLLLAADERAVLDARDVGRIRAREIAARAASPDSSLRQRARGDHLVAQAVVFGLAAVAPDDAVGLGQRGDFAHPAQQLARAARRRARRRMRRACCSDSSWFIVWANSGG